MRTIIPKGIGGSETFPKQSQNVSEGLESESERKVKYPMKLRHRGKGRVLVTLYKGNGHFTLYWRQKVDGKRRTQLKQFRQYVDAKRAADKLVNDLAKGNESALSPGQASDAQAAHERLRRFYQDTGIRVTMLSAVSSYADAAVKLTGITLNEAVDAYLVSVAAVKRKDVSAAVEEFIASEEPRTKSSNGERPQLSSGYAYQRAIMLRRFAWMFQNTALCEINKQHVDMFVSSLGKIVSKSRNHRPVASPKARNHHRGAIRQFFSWAVRSDYLAPTHRLNEANGLIPEKKNTAEVQFYTPGEFRSLVETADGPLQAIIAIGGLAGLRTSELLRLDWAEVWRVRDHIEVTAGKSKTRQRRLVEVCPALKMWLGQFRNFTSGRLWPGHEITFQQHFVDLCEKAKVKRKPNGLRHAFCTYHFAAHANEGLTAQQAGNSPQMIHQHYKGLATRKEALKWFAVKPAKGVNVIQLSTKADA